MNNQTAVAMLLQECKQALNMLLSAQADTGEEEREYQRCQALLPENLRTLLEEAREMKWPFVPEKWQYKQDLCPEDKTNLKGLIDERLPDLLVYLKASIMVKDCMTAAAIMFLIDRFLYWIDASSQLIQIAKGLRRLQATTPISPQVLIRQARLSINAGTAPFFHFPTVSAGTWRYAKESDRILVQLVCLQIRGQILQKLVRMWYEAAELIWSSVKHYDNFPFLFQGVATSLGIIGDIFASMNEKDYVCFKTKADMDLSLLQRFSHHLLSAAEACKLAAAYSQYTPLFVLSAMNIRGVCLLSYSHSKDCHPEKRKFCLSEAKESFEIGLLTKNDKSPVTSEEELHSFIKAAFCLTTVHRWLYGESEKLHEVSQLCREAMGKLHSYSTSFTEEEKKKTILAKEIMSVITSMKKHLQVESFPNSDARSYVPDSYKANFKKILTTHSQHHLSVCQMFKNTCSIHKTTPGETHAGACITTLRAEAEAIDTMCITEEIVYRRKGTAEMLNSPTAGSSSERFCGQKNKCIDSDVMNITFDEEAELLEIEINGGNSVFSRQQNRSQTTTPESSWCKLSKSTEKQRCRTESDEHSQAACLNLMPPRAWHSSPPEAPHSHGVSPQPSLDVDTTLAGRLVEKLSPCGEELREVGHQEKSSSEEKGGEVNNVVPSLSTSNSAVTKWQEEEEKSFTQVELGCKTKDSSTPLSQPRNHFVRVHPGGGAADSTEDPSFEAHPPTNEGASSVLPVSIEMRRASDSSVCDWLRKYVLVGNGPLKVPEVDTQAETIDDTEFDFIGIGDSVNNYPKASVPKHQSTPCALTALPLRGKISITEHFYCANTEKDEKKSQDMVSSKRQSSSFLSSWYKPAQMPKSSPRGPLLNPRGSGFVFMPGRIEEEIHDARFLTDDDYMQLLAGHNLKAVLWNCPFYLWCFLFVAAMLLKYSKKSGLWTGQETAVFIGDYLKVTKEGKKRSAFWIHFLHQEESLGRYVGKEYKEEKGLFHHFSDVEWQMTAQYCETEFNKRLYEQKFPTQIFYTPSAVLLILEDRIIKGCVSVEPYILGEFVKLSNNTKVAKNEYKATEYDLAYGHFTYEFSNGTDIVVDLQGWITGDGKGLVCLTDTQIHSLNSKDISLSNFGKKGIYYFFNNQHMECSEICRCLSLTRPSAELPM
uniref:Alpha kinase 1 n=2 Tax=Amazona TaxID=12929 RepID=A0A8B9FV00_9PSIT